MQMFDSQCLSHSMSQYTYTQCLTACHSTPTHSVSQHVTVHLHTVSHSMSQYTYTQCLIACHSTPTHSVSQHVTVHLHTVSHSMSQYTYTQCLTACHSTPTHSVSQHVTYTYTQCPTACHSTPTHTHRDIVLQTECTREKCMCSNDLQYSTPLEGNQLAPLHACSKVMRGTRHTG